jgi:succinate-semialdehyde dehydrogenase / glutarate-semialdehyde dehydrogenase
MSEPRLIALRDPRTGAPDGAIAAPNDASFDALCARLRAAQPAWAALPITARAQALLELRAAIAEEADAIAAGLEHDTGRRAIAKTEVQGVLGSLAGWASLAPHLLQTDWVQGRTAPHLKHAPNFKPYPLVGVISPWNFPLTLAMIDTIPALLAGCAVIVKPSEVTPRFIGPLRRAIARAPEIAKVLAFVEGDGAIGAGLCARADAICFTGSVATGRKVALACAERLIPAFLELGGKDPLIVLESAPLDHAVTAALRGSVLATGQACQSIERIYVARAIYTPFVERLAAAARSAPLNWPDINAGQIGPLIFAKQADTIAAQLADAYAKGARALAGGEIETHGGGLWLKPTVLVDVTHDMAIMREETFGPVMPVMAFDSVDAAVELANDSVFGLSGAVFAGTIEEAEAVGRRLECGAVSLNDAALTALFYEAEKNSFKQSGLGGSRMGLAGFQRFLRRQALIANTASPTPLSAFAESGPM